MADLKILSFFSRHIQSFESTSILGVTLVNSVLKKKKPEDLEGQNGICHSPIVFPLKNIREASCDDCII